MFKIIIIFLFIPCICFSEIHGDFRIGKTLDEDDAFAKIFLIYDFDILSLNVSLYGSWLTWFIFNGEQVFGQAPFRDIYEVGATLRYDIFFIDINHWCSHHVDSPTEKKHQNWHNDLTTLSIGIEW